MQQIGVWERVILGCLAALAVTLTCMSLHWLSPYEAFHVFWNEANAPAAQLAAAAVALVGLLFAVADFSFGYAVSFQLFLMIAGYLWLSRFSDLPYDHRSAEISAAASRSSFCSRRSF